MRDAMPSSILAAAMCLHAIIHGVQAVSSHQPMLMFVVFDGFRWDYMDKFDLPNFQTLATDGVRAGRVLNVMPTLTMASHFTMLTGLYPETHGMVLNDFHDPVHGDYDMYTHQHQTEAKWFDTGAEPIWVTNQKAAHDRFSAAMTWPTSLAPVMGIEPTFHKGPLYDITIKNKTRIDGIIRWFLHNEKPVNLGLLYFDEPDLVGHAFGPNSKQLEDNLIDLDIHLGYLISQLKKHGLFENLNLIVTADHGMADVPKHQFINISEFVSRDLYDEHGLSSILFIHPKPGKGQAVLEGLRKAERRHPQLHVHQKTSALLKSLNYTNSERIAPIVLIADEGWYLVTREEHLTNPDRGVHGYLPTLSNMNPFFLARGPAFKSGYFTPSVQSIDFYELMCHLLQLQPAPNNGSLDHIKHILRPERFDNSNLTWSYIASLTSLLTFLIAVLYWKPIKGNLLSVTSKRDD